MSQNYRLFCLPHLSNINACFQLHIYTGSLRVCSSAPQQQQRRRQRSAEMGAVPLKWLVLLVITLQTTALVLVMRYSRANSSGPPYFASTAVLLTEAAKCCVVLLTLWLENGELVTSSSTLIWHLYVTPKIIMESELIFIGQASVLILLSLDAQLTCQLYLYLYLLCPVPIVVSLCVGMLYVCMLYVCYSVVSVSGRRTVTPFLSEPVYRCCTGVGRRQIGNAWSLSPCSVIPSWLLMPCPADNCVNIPQAFMAMPSDRLLIMLPQFPTIWRT